MLLGIELGCTGMRWENDIWKVKKLMQGAFISTYLVAGAQTCWESLRICIENTSRIPLEGWGSWDPYARMLFSHWLRIALGRGWAVYWWHFQLVLNMGWTCLEIGDQRKCTCSEIGDQRKSTDRESQVAAVRTCQQVQEQWVSRGNDSTCYILRTELGAFLLSFIFSPCLLLCLLHICF